MDKLYIIKIGGNVIDDDAALKAFLVQFAAINGHKILVHGGGKLATELARQMAIPQQMIEGRRVTDESTLKLVTMVYAGYINKNIVASLQSMECNAIGMTGADADLAVAHKRNYATIDYGYVGDIDVINTIMLRALLEQNLAVVVAPITHDGKAQLLNTNADTMAQELATAMSGAYETSLVYCFEKAGVLLDVNDESTVIRKLNASYYKELKEPTGSEKRIFAGMIPKLDNAFAAIENGVKEVIIGKAGQIRELLAGSAGTCITHD